MILILILFFVCFAGASAGNSSDWMYRKSKGRPRNSKGGDK